MKIFFGGSPRDAEGGNHGLVWRRCVVVVVVAILWFDGFLLGRRWRRGWGQLRITQTHAQFEEKLEKFRPAELRDTLPAIKSEEKMVGTRR